MGSMPTNKYLDEKIRTVILDNSSGYVAGHIENQNFYPAPNNQFNTNIDKSLIYYQHDNLFSQNPDIKCLWTDNLPDLTCNNLGNFKQLCKYSDGTLKDCPDIQDSSIQYLRDYSCHCDKGKTYSDFNTGQNQIYGGKNCQFNDNIMCNGNGIYNVSKDSCSCNSLFTGPSCGSIIPDNIERSAAWNWGNQSGIRYDLYPADMNRNMKISSIFFRTNSSCSGGNIGRRTSQISVGYKHIYNGSVVTETPSSPQRKDSGSIDFGTVLDNNMYSTDNGFNYKVYGAGTNDTCYYNNTQLDLGDNEWIFKIQLWLGNNPDWDSGSIRGLGIWYGTDPLNLKYQALGDAGPEGSNDGGWPADKINNCASNGSNTGGHGPANNNGTGGCSKACGGPGCDPALIKPDAILDLTQGNNLGKVVLYMTFFGNSNGGWGGISGAQVLVGNNYLFSKTKGPIFKNRTVNKTTMNGKEYCLGIDNNDDDKFNFYPLAYSLDNNSPTPVTTEQCNTDLLSKSIRGDMCSSVLKNNSGTWQYKACNIQPVK
jgi:hypothetical protein